MTYLINQNRERYFDDSLVFSFETFFYDKDHELTIDRMKKLGLKATYVEQYKGLGKDNIPKARHASVIVTWTNSK